MLDGAHRLALRAVAGGTAKESDAAAVRNLAVAGLVQPVDGAWTLTQAGHAVLELEGGAAAPAGGGGQGQDLKARIREWFMT
jgi:hypothetical protein